MQVGALALELHVARLGRRAIPTISERRNGFDRPTAYAVQEAGIELRERAGEQRIGGKLGFTSRAMQRAMGVPSPNYGWLTDAMLRDGTIELGELIHPKVEPEIAFLLADDLGPGPVDASAVLAATTSVAPCLEVVDSRFVDFVFGPLDNIADNSSAGQVILGAWQPLPDVSLAQLGVVLAVDGEVAATAAGAAALDDPAAAVAWMAEAVGAGPRPLRRGDIVISGGLTAPVDLSPGMTVTLEIDRLGMCQLEVRSN